MAYLNLAIKSGGIVSKAADWQLNMETELAEDQQKLRLIRFSSIEGIWAYLLGYTCKIKDNREHLELDLDWVWLCKNTKIQITREPFASTFFSRKDFHFDKSQYPINPSVNLSNFNYSDADGTIQLLYPILKKMTGSGNLSDIHAHFDDKKFKKKKKDVPDLIRPDVSALPNSKMGKAMKKYVEEIFDSETYDKAIFLRALELIQNTTNEIQSNKNFSDAFEIAKESKFSCFTTSLNQPRHWIKAEKQSYVRGEPKNLICVDFELIIESKPSESVVNRLLAGPLLASWGEGGFGILKYNSANLLPNALETEQPFLSYKELRNLNLKLKLQTWEAKAKAKFSS